MRYKLILSGLLASYSLVSSIKAMEVEEEKKAIIQLRIQQEYQEEEKHGCDFSRYKDTKEAEQCFLKKIEGGTLEFCSVWLFKVDDDPSFQIDTTIFCKIVKKYFYRYTYIPNQNESVGLSRWKLSFMRSVDPIAI